MSFYHFKHFFHYNWTYREAHLKNYPLSISFQIKVSIYKARNLILGVEEPPLCADIPTSYHLPNSAPVHSSFPSSDLLPTPTNVNPSPISPLLSPLISPTWQFPAATISQTTVPFVGMMQQPQFLYNVMQQSMGSSG